MAHVSGPTSRLPGSRHPLPAGAMCDDHPDRPAVARIQGETDSFGAEYLDLCQECVDKVQAGESERRTGRCDWCANSATDLANHRDLDEGLSGRVYRVCGSCRATEAQLLREEFDDDY